MGIIRRATLNKRTKQLSITIPKREFKKMNPRMKLKEGMEFRIEPLIKKKLEKLKGGNRKI